LNKMDDTELHSKVHRGGFDAPTQAYIGRVPSLRSKGLSGKRQGEQRGADKDGAKKTTWYEAVFAIEHNKS